MNKLTKYTSIQVSNGNPREAVNDFFKKLLENKIVNAVMIPVETIDKVSYMQRLITNPKELERANAFSPVMAVNSATLLKNLTKKGSPSKKIAVVLKPCEMRATIELIKLKQINPDNLIFFGVDCPGTISVSTYKALINDGKDTSNWVFDAVSTGQNIQNSREICKMCEYPEPLNTDFVLGLFGLDFNKEVLLKVNTEKGLSLLGAMEFQMNDEPPAGREDAVTEWTDRRTKVRDDYFNEFSNTVAGVERLSKTFSSCIGCHNCKTACPICFCKECFFESSAVEYEGRTFDMWLDSRDAMTMPTDRFLFHIGRMAHMATSCVGCGMCEQACPTDIPIGRIFKTVAHNVQNVFDYVAGRSLDEPVPLSTFKEHELEPL